MEKPKAEKLEASKPEPAKAEPETSRLRRSNTTNGLRRQNSVSVLGMKHPCVLSLFDDCFLQEKDGDRARQHCVEWCRQKS